MESAREKSCTDDLRTGPATNNLGEFQHTPTLTEQGHGGTINTTPTLSSPQNPFLESSLNDHDAYEPSPVNNNPFQDQTTTNNNKANNVTTAESSDDDDDIPISYSGSNLEPSTNNKGTEIQNPPMQVMERQGDSSSTTNPSSYTFPSHVFARNNTNNGLVEWSTASNESLFSIYMGNMSFSNEIPNFSGGAHNSKSTELDKPYEVMPMPDQQPLTNNNNAASSSSPISTQPPTAAVVIATTPTPTPTPTPVNKFNDISQRTAELHAAKATEAKAAETMREVIMETSRTNNDNNGGVGKGGDDKNSNTRHQSDGSTQSFAFQSISSKGEEKQKQLQKQQTEKKETANAVEEASKTNTNPAPSKGWLSCFPCCS